MTETGNNNFSFDGLPRTVAELHAKIDRLTAMLERFVPPADTQPLPEIMTVEDVSAMLRKSVSTIYAMTSEHRIPYRKQGNKLYFMRTEIKSWLMDSVVPKDTPKRGRKPDAQEGSHEPDGLKSETGTRTGQPDEESGTSANESPTENDTGTERQNPPYTIEQRTHTRNGTTIFAVSFPDEIETAGERKFARTARELHGYWSGFGNGGYIFNTRQVAENFAKAIIGKEENKRTTEEGLARSYSPL